MIYSATLWQIEVLPSDHPFPISTCPVRVYTFCMKFHVKMLVLKDGIKIFLRYGLSDSSLGPLISIWTPGGITDSCYNYFVRIMSLSEAPPRSIMQLDFLLSWIIGQN